MQAMDNLVLNLGECMKVRDVELVQNVFFSKTACLRQYILEPFPQHAVDRGLNLAVNVRVDDGRALGGWRNTIDFDPLARHGRWSYAEAFLYPIIDALKLASTPETKVKGHGLVHEFACGLGFNKVSSHFLLQRRLI